MKTSIVKLLCLLLVCCLFLPAALGEGTRDVLTAAQSMTNEELYALAQKELGEDGQMFFYSVTSVAEQAAEYFMQQYPALSGKIVYRAIDGAETYKILTTVIGSDMADPVDMALVQSGADLRVFLLNEGLTYNYFPDSQAEYVDPVYRDPTVLTYISSLFIGKSTGDEIRLTNIWELTENRWNGRVYFKNPLQEAVNLNFLIMLTTDEWKDTITAAYEAYYGTAWNNTDIYENAAFEWIDRFLDNAKMDYTSATKMAQDVADGTEGKLGLFVSTKLRRLTAEQRSVMQNVSLDSDITGFSGFMYPVYATVCSDTNCPYTCALFINYLLSQEGFAGENSWNSYTGYYTPNTSVKKPEDLEDRSFSEWSRLLVVEDIEYIDANYMKVFEFVATKLLYGK